MRRHKRRQHRVFATDLFILYLAVALSYLIQHNYSYDWNKILNQLLIYTPLIFLWLFSQYVEGLYSLKKYTSRVKYVIQIFLAGIASFCAGIILVYLFENTLNTSTQGILLFTLTSFTLLSIWRYLFSIIQSMFITRSKIAVVGISDILIDMLDNEDKHSFFGYSIAGIYAENSDKKFYIGLPVYNDFDTFLKEIFDKNVSQVVLIDDSGLSNKIKESIFSLLEQDITFISIEDFYETYMRKVAVSEISSLWFLKNLNFGQKKIYSRIVKRTADIVLSVFIILFSVPFFPLIALLIKIDSKGPIFFKQRRTGYLGIEYTLYKLRTMTTTDNDSTPTLENDRRITRFGNFMRRTRIDEIPQIINVLKGDMSLIGPRPERPELIEELEKVVPFYRQRLLVKPGITGWDQVSGEYHSPSVEDTMKKLQSDFYYMKNISFELDFSIFAKTIKTMITRRGL